MINLCGKSVAYFLKLIFHASLLDEKFPECWKSANVVPVHKKESKNLVKNYRPIGIFPILENIWKVQFSRTCLITSIKINYLLSFSLVRYLPFTVIIYCS